MAYGKDGWTKIPNEILIALPLMSGNMVKVIFHIAHERNKQSTEKPRISIRDFCDGCGISNRSAIDSISGAIDAGYIERERDGKDYLYDICSMKKVHLNGDSSEESSLDESEKTSQMKVKKLHTSLIYKKDQESKRESEIVSEVNFTPSLKSDSFDVQPATSTAPPKPRRRAKLAMDARKLVNNLIPAGQGSTATEVYREVFDNQPTHHQMQEMNRRVTDFEKWRNVCQEWSLKGFRQGNFEGLFDWYEGNRRDETNRKNPPTNGSHPNGNTGSYTGPKGNQSALGKELQGAERDYWRKRLADEKRQREQAAM